MPEAPPCPSKTVATVDTEEPPIVSASDEEVLKSKLTRLSSRQRSINAQRKAARLKQANAKFLRSYYASNKQTLFVACKAVIIGSIFMAFGLCMSVVGYFDYDLATSVVFDEATNTSISVVDRRLRLLFKSMQYFGPIFMGIGFFALITACVMTLESRDKHAQIIQQETSDITRLPVAKLPTMVKDTTTTSLLSSGDDCDIECGQPSASSAFPPKTNGHAGPNTSSATAADRRATIPDEVSELSVQRFLSVNTCRPKGPAPIAVADSLLDLGSTPQRSPRSDPGTLGEF